MRILYFVNGLNYKGGIARIVVDKANYMVDKFGYEVGICTINGSTSSAYILSDKITVFALSDKGLERQGIIGKLKGVFSNIKNVKRVIKDYKPDIIDNAQTQIITWVLPFIYRMVPKVMEIHFSKIGMGINLRNRSKLFKWLYFKTAELIYAKYNKFVVLTEEDKRYWRHNKNIAVIGNFTTFETDRLSPLTAKNVICVARYQEQKRLDLLIEAWAKVYPYHPNWTLNVYGMGPDKQMLESKVIEAGLQHSMKLNDAVNDIKKKYMESSIFALSSQHEGFALVLLEAMKMGLPICAFDVVGVSCLIKNGQTGLTCKFGDTNAFAANLNTLMGNYDKRKYFRDSNIAFCRGKFSIQNIMNKWKNLYENLL